MKQRAFEPVRLFLFTALAFALPAANPVAAEGQQAPVKRLISLDEAIVSALHKDEGLQRAEDAFVAAGQKRAKTQGQQRFFLDLTDQLAYNMMQVEREQAYQQALSTYREAAYKLAFQVRLTYWQAYWNGAIAAQKHAARQTAEQAAKAALTKQLYGFSDDAASAAAQEKAKQAAAEAAAADQAYAGALQQLVQQAHLESGSAVELLWKEEWLNSEKSLGSSSDESGDFPVFASGGTSRMAEQKLAVASTLFFHPAIFFTTRQVKLGSVVGTQLADVQQEQRQAAQEREQYLSQLAQAKAEASTAKAAYDKARGNLEAAQRTASRAEALYLAGSLQPQELERLQAAVAAARAELANAEYAYRFSVCKASEWTTAQLQVVESQLAALIGNSQGDS